VKALFIGKTKIKLESVNSSNNYALKLLKNTKLHEGTIIWAIEQKKGKGQRGKYWESEKGKNLTFSIIFFPEFLKAEEQFYLSKVISLGVTDFLKNHVENVSIKWANDIYVNNKKIAGILIENSIKKEKIVHTVAGIGLNLNQTKFISNATNPISLKLLTKNQYDLEKSLNLLCNYIEKRYIDLQLNHFEQIDKDYLEILYHYNEYHSYSSKGKTFKAKIKGIAKTGELILQNKKGEEKKYTFEEISFVN